MLKTVLIAVSVLAVPAGLAACDRGSIVRKDALAIPRAAQAVGGQPSFVGRWALRADDCGGRNWTLTAERVQSPGALACSITQLTPTLAGYTAYSGCSSGAATTPGRVVMTLTGGPPASSLTLNGGPFAEPVSLVRCPA